MHNDTHQVNEQTLVGAAVTTGETFKEAAIRATVRKYDAATLDRATLLTPDGRLTVCDERFLQAAGIDPYEVVEGEPGNLLMYGGASALWDLLIAGATVTAFNNANAYLGVGDSTTAAAATQTDLQAVTNKNRQGMVATYPTHTDGVVSGSADCVWKSQWGTAAGNYVWAEWALFNASTAGRMLNRKVEALGTKTSAAVWNLTVTLTLS